jgi:exopolysaccharide biosynthesis polyprenyl glycosylphosphotransferase
MLNEHVTYFRKLLVAMDVVVVTFGFFLTYLLFHDLRKLYSLEYYFWVLPVLLTLWVSLLYAFGMYVSFRLKGAWEILWIVARAAVLGFIIFSNIYFLFKIIYLSRSFIVLLFAITSTLLTVEKLALMVFFKRLRKLGFNFKNVLVVGTDARAQSYLAKVNQTPEFGLKVVGIVDLDPGRVGEEVEGHRVIGSLDSWKEIVSTHTVDHVFFFVPHGELGRIEEPITHCETVGIPVSVAVNFFNVQTVQGRHSEEFGIPLITYDATSGKVGQIIFKRVFDIVFSLIALLLILPLMLVIGILVKATSEGPMFFKQQRCTLNGRKFYIYKFRTMAKDAERRLIELMAYNEMKGAAFKMTADPRLTKLGSFLRKYSLDELPQFWNVLIGNMSIVGPRPPLPLEVAMYQSWQKRRLSMRAGLTCLWQISGRNNITDFEEWAKLDLEYIQNWTLGLDYKIILKTIPAVLWAKGSR